MIKHGYMDNIANYFCINGFYPQNNINNDDDNSIARIVIEQCMKTSIKWK